MGAGVGVGAGVAAGAAVGDAVGLGVGVLAGGAVDLGVGVRVKVGAGVWVRVGAGASVGEGGPKRGMTDIINAPVPMLILSLPFLYAYRVMLSDGVVLSNVKPSLTKYSRYLMTSSACKR